VSANPNLLSCELFLFSCAMHHAWLIFGLAAGGRHRTGIDMRYLVRDGGGRLNAELNGISMVAAKLD